MLQVPLCRTAGSWAELKLIVLIQRLLCVAFIAPTFVALIIPTSTSTSVPFPQNISGLSDDVLEYSIGPNLLAKTGNPYGVTLLTVLLRKYSRRFIVKSFGEDDWAMLLALVMNPSKTKLQGLL